MGYANELYKAFYLHELRESDYEQLYFVKMFLNKEIKVRKS